MTRVLKSLFAFGIFYCINFFFHALLFSDILPNDLAFTLGIAVLASWPLYLTGVFIAGYFIGKSIQARGKYLSRVIRVILSGVCAIMAASILPLTLELHYFLRYGKFDFIGILRSFVKDGLLILIEIIVFISLLLGMEIQYRRSGKKEEEESAS